MVRDLPGEFNEGAVEGVKGTRTSTTKSLHLKEQGNRVNTGAQRE
jgi:hypothetical protein